MSAVLEFDIEARSEAGVDPHVQALRAINQRGFEIPDEQFVPVCLRIIRRLREM